MKKKLTLTLASLVTAALLSGCGGGGAAPAAPAPAPVTPPPTVASMTAPTLTAADCPRLMSNDLSSAALDLTDPNIKTVNDFLKQVDPDHAYNVFTRRPADFVNKIVTSSGGTGTLNLRSVGEATERTQYMVDLDSTALFGCAPAGYKMLFFGTITDTGLKGGDTAGLQIIDAVIDPALKTDYRYASMVTAPGNFDFVTLLDGFAASAGAAHTEFGMLAAGKAASTAGAVDYHLGVTINWMVYLEAYLQAARLNQPATYAKIVGSAPTIAAIQALWDRAEKDLRESAPWTALTAQPGLIVNREYLSAAYSASLLSELDAIHVTHTDVSAWKGTYLP